MTKIVLNQCPNGALLSPAGVEELKKRGGTTKRDDPVLVALMEEDEHKRVWAGACSHVSIVEMPDGMPWHLMDEGKFEWLAAGDLDG